MTGVQTCALPIYGPILREAGLETNVSDEALLVPKGPELDLEPVEAAR